MILVQLQKYYKAIRMNTHLFSNKMTNRHKPNHCFITEVSFSDTENGFYRYRNKMLVKNEES